MDGQFELDRNDKHQPFPNLFVLIKLEASWVPVLIAYC